MTVKEQQELETITDMIWSARWRDCRRGVKNLNLTRRQTELLLGVLDDLVEQSRTENEALL
jgi:hypothetical protein